MSPSTPNPKKFNFLKQLFKYQPDNLDNVELTTQNQVNLLHYYTSLASFNPKLIIVFSPTGEVISLNQNNLKKKIGFTPRNKNDFKKLVTGAEYKVIDQAFTNTLKRKPSTHEIQIKNVAGNSVFLLLTFIPITMKHEQAEGVYLIIDNITERVSLRESLKLSQQHLTHANEVAGVATFEYLIEEDSFLYAKDFYELVGLTETHVISINKPFKLIHPEDYERVNKIIFESIEHGNSFVVEFRIYHGQTNELRYVRVKADAVRENEKVKKLVGIAHDITLKKQFENDLKSTNKRLLQVFDNLNAGIWMREKVDGEIIFASKGLSDILEVPPTEIYENLNYWRKLILPAHRDYVSEQYQILKEGKPIDITFRINSAQGTTKWLREQTIPSLDEDGNLVYIYGMVSDVSNEIDMQEQLNYLEKYNAISGLPNRKSLDYELDVLCQQGTPFALLYLDLDRFSIINDSLGNDIGDRALKSVASRLLAYLPENGYVAHTGSNDFIMLVKDYQNQEEIMTVAQQLMELIKKPLMITEYELYITTSMGMSFFPEDGKSKQELVARAHKALHQAKKRGKDNYQLYSFTKDISSYKKYMLDRDMRKAIRYEEFEIYYQPQIEPKRGLIKGAEALLRWNHKDWGLVSPGEFIPLAEENHLINDIGDWVITKVIAQLKTWKDDGQRLKPISINISPLRLLKKGLITHVKEQLDFYQIPAKYIILEITETSILNENTKVLSTLKALRELGVRIAIDDFGVGFSSLSYLKNFEWDILKIDKSFIGNIGEEDSKETAIVSSLLHLANGLNLSVVAEGVEEYEQFEFLKQKECSLIQGYLFSEPVPLKAFEKMNRVGLLKPTKNNNKGRVPTEERRKYFRFSFPFPVRAEMTITEVKKQKVTLGTSDILIDNIGLGGIKIISPLKLPINADFTFKFQFKIMKEIFDIQGALKWINEEKSDCYTYGVAFDLSASDEDRLAKIINKITTLQNLNQEIPDTDFIYEDPYSYMRKYLG